MRYQLQRLDPRPGPDGRRTGRILCRNASPEPTGPNRITMAIYEGPLIGTAAIGWEPAFVKGEGPGQWTEATDARPLT